ncbi:YncE family protein [Pedobacter sp. JCM 36344]|uniref:YncE family protein n=1 Tax=Pedobacter sp. JCM 36344 TaxID=3374280 RepID=UPI003979EA7A
MNKTITNFIKMGLVLLVGTTLFGACTKDRGIMVLERLPKETIGVYTLGEGAFGAANNSTITYYDVTASTTTKDFFKKQNGIDLGTNANDLKQYGSKMYCVVTGTAVAAKDSYVEVINISTGKSVKRIPFYDASKGFLPRHVGFYKGKAYVSSYDGFVSRIDTAVLNIEARIAVGGALDGLAVVNNKLYVANSLTPSFPSTNNASISVVDLTSFTKLKEIAVNTNPTTIATTASGEIYAITNGTYTPPFIAPSLERINATTDTKTQTYNYSLGGIAIDGAQGLVIVYGDYPAPNSLKRLNVSTGATGADFITDNTAIASLYAITINPLNGDVFVADANNYGTEGKVIAFSSTGKRKFEFFTGAIPQTVVFNYSYK